MTPNDFRKLALSFPETAERAHMNHPDFRVAGKLFATLSYPNKEWAMVKITPVEQEMLVRAEPTVFSPVNGAWGRKGCTSVNLKAARKTTLRRALAAAWQLAAPENLSRGSTHKVAAAPIEKLREKTAKASREKASRFPKARSSGRERS
jgi:hypothetical protein